MYGMLQAIAIEDLGQNSYKLRLAVEEPANAGDVLQSLVVDLGMIVTAERRTDATIGLIAVGAWQQVVVVLAAIADNPKLFHLPANKVIETLS